VVLIIAVHGDDAQRIRPIFQHPAEGGLQGSALATVELVMQKVYFRMGSGGLEIVEVLRLAAVVNKNDVREAVFQQTVDDGQQLVVRIQRGEDNGDILKGVHIGSFPDG
jgi:hypothetical protein